MGQWNTRVVQFFIASLSLANGTCLLKSRLDLTANYGGSTEEALRGTFSDSRFQIPDSRFQVLDVCQMVSTIKSRLGYQQSTGVDNLERLAIGLATETSFILASYSGCAKSSWFASEVQQSLLDIESTCSFRVVRWHRKIFQ